MTTAIDPILSDLLSGALGASIAVDTAGKALDRIASDPGALLAPLDRELVSSMARHSIGLYPTAQIRAFASIAAAR